MTNCILRRHFPFQNFFYVDDSVFLHDNKKDVQKAAETILEHFKRFGRTMHVGNHMTNP
jgi:hypothetical protein